MGLLRVGHGWATSLSLFAFMHWRRNWQPTPVFLPGESQGRRSLLGCRLWGSYRVGHDWSDLAAAAVLLRLLLKWCSAKEPACRCMRRRLDPWVEKIPLEEEMATHSSILAWRIPGTGEPCGLPSMGSHRVGQDWSDLAAAAAVYSKRVGYNLATKHHHQHLVLMTRTR